MSARTVASVDELGIAFERGAIPQGVFDAVTLQFIAVNAATVRAYGFATEELLSRTVGDLVVEEDRARLRDACRSTAPPASTWRLRERSGGLRTVRVHSVAIRIAARRAVLVQAVDVTDQRQVEEGLRESTALLRTISNQSDDVIFAKDTAGRMLFANPATLALVGKPLDAVIGRTDLEILENEEAARALMANDRRIMQRGVAEELEEVVPRPDGTVRTWLSRKVPFRAPDGSVAGLVGISRDITARKAAEAEREEMLAANTRLFAEAEAASRQKDHFLATLSHELRTPLNVVLGHSRMLRQAADDPERVARGCAVIERNALVQLKMIEDLLDVQRILRGGLTVERAPFDLSILGQSVIDALQPLASAKQLHVASRFTEITVEADRARIQQVLWNLLANAIKFTPDGGCIGIWGRPLDQAFVELGVEDSGGGIAESFLPHLFEPFRQADTSTTRRHGGLGLGLAIVRHIVEAHGGSIDVRSTEGLGTCFTVRLPVGGSVGGSVPG